MRIVGDPLLIQMSGKIIKASRYLAEGQHASGQVL
jgi:hypothetical protein